MPRSFPERLTKAATLAAVALAFPVHLTVDPAVGLPLRVIAAVAFAAAFFCARRSPSMTVAVVAGAGPVLPALFAASLHVAALNAFYTTWLAALFGAMLPGMPRDRWELPRAWRLPLGVWGLTLSLAWPVLILREAGLRLAMLRDTGALDSWAYLNTPQVESWILHVVLAQLVGLLWLEWLFRPEPAEPSAPAPEQSELNAGLSAGYLSPAAHGLWIGASIASLVAIYQGTVNMAFLSGGPWPGLRRAAGTLLDANAYGTVAALAGPIAFVSIPFLFASLRTRHARLAQAAALALNWGGAWMSGSRTALVCGAFGTVMLVYGLLRDDRRAGVQSRNTQSLLAGVALVILLLAMMAGAIGPLKRITERSSANASVGDLWRRGGYGTVAVRMVRDYPLTGVGAGSFNWMAPDYWRVLANDKLPFDNAQNWWRHQVAELGAIASLPILIWSGMIAWIVATRRSRPGARVETGTVRGLLIGIGAASLLGVPTQNPIVLVIFFYLVARFEALTGSEGLKSQGPNPKVQIPSAEPESGIRTAAWTAGMLVAIGYACAHLALAHGALNPRARAAASNRDYVTGTYPSEPLPQGQFRWTRKHATFALAVPSRYLVIRFHVGNPDVAARPVKLRITTPCEALVDAFESDTDIGAVTYLLPEGMRRIVFDTDVSRTWKPSDSGQPDSRVLGAAIEADFVGTPAVVASQDRWIPLKSCPNP